MSTYARKLYYTGPGNVPRCTKTRYCTKKLPPLLTATQDCTTCSALTSQLVMEAVNSHATVLLTEELNCVTQVADSSNVLDSSDDSSDENFYSDGDSSDRHSQSSDACSELESNDYALDNDEPIKFEPLFQGLDVSSFDYHVPLKECALKHHITKEAYQDLLTLVAGILPSPNKALKSHYTISMRCWTLSLSHSTTIVLGVITYLRLMKNN